MNLQFHLQEDTSEYRRVLQEVSERGRYLIVPSLDMRGVGRLVANEHVVEVEPGEGGDWTGVVGEVGNEAICGGFGDVEDQELLGSFLIFSINRSRG